MRVYCKIRRDGKKATFSFELNEISPILNNLKVGEEGENSFQKTLRSKSFKQIVQALRKTNNEFAI